MKNIEKIICKYFYIDKEQIIHGNSRKSKFILPKQFCFMFYRKLTTLSYTEIGEIFNNNHATVISGIKTIQDRIDTEPKIMQYYEELNHIFRKSNICTCMEFPRPLILKAGEIFCTKCNLYI